MGFLFGAGPGVHFSEDIYDSGNEFSNFWGRQFLRSSRILSFLFSILSAFCSIENREVYREVAGLMSDMDGSELVGFVYECMKIFK